MKRKYHLPGKQLLLGKASLCAIAVLLTISCKKMVSSDNQAADGQSATSGSGLKTNSYPKNPISGQLVFGTADSGGDMGSVGAFEYALQTHGADPGFKFGGLRSYLKIDSDLPATLLPFTAKAQGSGGRQYIPLISFRTQYSNGTHMKYPLVWAGNNDANWKKQLDQIATQYGTTSSPVVGPNGTKAYPVILTFNHEMDLDGETGPAYDPTNPLTKQQQFAKAFRYVQDLQRSYKPGLNALWTWIPTAYSVRNYTGTGMNPVFEFWPSRNTNGTGGSIDDGTPNLTNVSRVDIMGCDAYMNDFSFADAVNKGGTSAKSSFINMTKSVGTGTGMPWLLGEWGIDDRCSDNQWKKNTFDAMMTNLASTDYLKCVFITIWPTGTTQNDNRWNSPSKANDGDCAYPWPAANSNGYSALGFTSHLATGVALPNGRPNIFGL